MDNPETTMTFDEFVAEYGSLDERRASLKATYTQYASDEDVDAWLDAQNEEATSRSIAQGRY